MEVRPIWANKGEAFSRLQDAQPNADFLFAAGDDHTDEDLFERMRAGAWAVHVGPGSTCVGFVAPDCEFVRRLLGMFTEATFRRSLLHRGPKHRLQQLAKRFTKIIAKTGKVYPFG